MPPTWHINEDITIAAGEWKDYESFDVQQGQKISLTLNGDGDADMYVGLSQAPNDDYNACSGTISTKKDVSLSKYANRGLDGTKSMLLKVSPDQQRPCSSSYTNSRNRYLRSEVQELLEMSSTQTHVLITTVAGMQITLPVRTTMVLRSVDINECAADNGAAVPQCLPSVTITRRGTDLRRHQ